MFPNRFLILVIAQFLAPIEISTAASVANANFSATDEDSETLSGPGSGTAFAFGSGIGVRFNEALSSINKSFAEWPATYNNSSAEVVTKSYLPDVYNCSKQQYIPDCTKSRGKVKTPQFTLRWYLNPDTSNCSSYPWAYCPGRVIREQNVIRTLEDCQALCETNLVSDVLSQRQRRAALPQKLLSLPRKATNQNESTIFLVGSGSNRSNRNQEKFSSYASNKTTTVATKITISTTTTPTVSNLTNNNSENNRTNNKTNKCSINKTSKNNNSSTPQVSNNRFDTNLTISGGNHSRRRDIQPGQMVNFRVNSSLSLPQPHHNTSNTTGAYNASYSNRKSHGNGTSVSNTTLARQAFKARSSDNFIKSIRVVNATTAEGVVHFNLSNHVAANRTRDQLQLVETANGKPCNAGPSGPLG